MGDFGLVVQLPPDPGGQRGALARLLGAAAVLDPAGTDATWDLAALPRRGVVTVPGGVDHPCRVGSQAGHLWLILDAEVAQAEPRVARWLDAVSRRVGLPRVIGPVDGRDLLRPGPGVG